MAADDVQKSPDPARKQKRRRKVRDELARIRRAMDKTQRDAKAFILSDYDEDIPKGVNEDAYSRDADLMVRVKSSALDPSSSVTAEATNPEVEWALSRTSNAKAKAKRSGRGHRRILAH